MLALISHRDCLLHDPGSLHPESPNRLHEIDDYVIASRLELAVRRVDAPLATQSQLARAHDAAYVDRMFKIAPKEGTIEFDSDTILGPGTLKAARRAAGAGIKGVDLILTGEIDTAFCNVRPPGHHAGVRSAKGFCFFNNIAVAARHAVTAHDIGRLAIVDFDAHRGDGTEEIFRNDERVLLCTCYQHPFYPHVEHSGWPDNLIAVPLAAGTASGAFREAITAKWLPALDAFRPKFIFVSAGFDGHALDAMSDLQLWEDDYSWITNALRNISDRRSSGRILSMLEGGYAPGAVARSVTAHLEGLIG